MGLFGKKKKDKEVERATIRCWAMLEKFMDSGGAVPSDAITEISQMLSGYSCIDEEDCAHYHAMMAYVSYKMGDEKGMWDYLERLLPTETGNEDSLTWIFVFLEADNRTRAAVIRRLLEVTKSSFALQQLFQVLIKTGDYLSAEAVVNNYLVEFPKDSIALKLKKKLEKLRR